MGAEIGPTITIVDGSKKYVYEKFCGKTVLRDYSFTDDRNFTFERYISSIGYCSSYFNEEYKLGLSVLNVSYIDMKDDNEVSFINELNDLIIHVVFPIDIANFSNKVFHLLEGYDCDFYNRINITFYKYYNLVNSICIVVNNGKIVEIDYKKDGYTICVNSNDTWSYKKDDLEVKKHESYVEFFRKYSEKEFNDSVGSTIDETPNNTIKYATKKAEEVKQLRLSILNKNKNS